MSQATGHDAKIQTGMDKKKIDTYREELDTARVILANPKLCAASGIVILFGGENN